MTPLYRSVAGLLALFLLLPGLLQAASALEQATERYITHLDELGQILATVQDEDSAKAAKPKLQETMLKLRAVLKQFDKVSAATRAQLERRYETRMGAVAERLQQQVGRVMSHPHIRPHIEEALSRFPTLN
jgi:biopolymer transport protein ExbB/TolQ